MDAISVINGQRTPFWRGIAIQAPSSDAEPEDPSPAEARILPDRVAAPKGRILIVDDDESVREILAELLDLAGFVTVQAAHAEPALAVLRRDPEIAALVTDLTMPGDDGITLIRLARALRAGIPAILLTGYAEEVTAVSTIAGGNFHVLRKPVESDRLIEQLELLLTSDPGR
ncbi:MAG TPA: hypothetical protein DDZ81_10325 [Acetobacteraceae bacterium]|jgi:DNA-binding NtrC family response regulator|nr:hypothetical protein [Acetobacteraceae bacterium]